MIVRIVPTDTRPPRAAALVRDLELPDALSPEALDRIVANNLAHWLDAGDGRFQAFMTDFDRLGRCTAMRVVVDEKRSVDAQITYHDAKRPETTP